LICGRPLADCLRRAFWHAVATLVFAVPWAPCAAAAEPVVVTAVLPADWDNLDPHRMRTTGAFQMAVALYDRLVALGPDGEVVPYLAESWSATATGATLKIRPGAVCADGTPVTANVVAVSLRRLADPQTRAPYATRTFGPGQPVITADDATGQVSIVLKASNSDLMLALAMPWSSITCPASSGPNPGHAGVPTGSGPYQLTAQQRGDRYVLTRRPEYRWGPALPPLSGRAADRINLLVAPNPSTAANLIATGAADIAFISGRDTVRLRREPDLQTQEMTYFGADGLLFAQSDGRPGEDPAVRMALALMIDNRGFNKAFTFGHGSASDTLTTPSMQCYDPGVGAANPPYDPQRAKTMLEAAGYRRDDAGFYARNGLELVVRIAGNRTQNAGPEFLLESWRAQGVRATLVMAEFNTWLETVTRTSDWDVTVWPFNSVIPSPSLFVAQLTGEAPPRGTNYMGRENHAYSAAAQRAQEAAPEGRCANWAEAEQALLSAGSIKALAARKIAVFSRGLSFVMLSPTVFDPHQMKRSP